MEHNGQISSKNSLMFKDNLSSWTWPGFEGQTGFGGCVPAWRGGAVPERCFWVAVPWWDFTATYSVPTLPASWKAVGHTGGCVTAEFNAVHRNRRPDDPTAEIVSIRKLTARMPPL